jgi:hypothetical protein
VFDEGLAGLLLALLLASLDSREDLAQAVFEAMLLQQAHESLGRRLVGARGHREAWTEGLHGLEDKRRVRNCHSSGAWCLRRSGVQR